MLVSMVNTGSATDRKLNWFAALYADRRPIDVTAHWYCIHEHKTSTRYTRLVTHSQIYSVLKVVTDLLRKINHS
jgi:hypothetical protein